MSLFKTYSPQLLWKLSLQLVNSIFRNPPKMKVEPESYFKSILEAHQIIRDDLTGTFDPHNITLATANTTIGQIYSSLQELDQMLFGSTTDVSVACFSNSIEGCCLYTKYLEQRLKKSTNTCLLL
tara:strand:+ start:3747 stop:4121 length:375 start_codon:yes stop_codon:yes gene_type:complete